MRDLPTKVDGDTLAPTDFNANLKDELQNVVESAGFTLDPAGGADTDLNMFGQSVAQYSSGAWYYVDSGSANAYVLTRIGNLKSVKEYQTGMIARFKATNSSTSTSTVNIDSLGSKAITINAVALTSGEIEANNYYDLIYNGTSFDLFIYEGKTIITTQVKAPSGQSTSLTDNSGDGITVANGGIISANDNLFINCPSIFPVGGVLMWTGDTSPDSDIWIPCDGQFAGLGNSTEEDYPDLFNVLTWDDGGTLKAIWGSLTGSGSTRSVPVPDLRDIFVRGWHDSKLGSWSDPDVASRGVQVGSGRTGSLGQSGSSQLDAGQGHWHNFVRQDLVAAGGGGYSAYKTVLNGTVSNVVRDAVTDGTHGTPRISSVTRPKNVSILYLIKAK